LPQKWGLQTSRAEQRSNLQDVIKKQSIER
jgi:hypothetical protein